MLVIVRYQFFETADNEDGIISLQYLSKKGSSDTIPEQPPSKEKTTTGSVSQKKDSKNSQSNSKQEENSTEPPVAPPVDPPIEPPAEIYAVHPIIFIGSDTSINVTNYQNQVSSSFEVVRDWYQGQLGKTFNLIPRVSKNIPSALSNV